MSEAPVTPEEALDNLFTVIREEAIANPKFAKRLFDAVRMPVLFQGGDAALTVDPVVAAKRNDQATFREMFSTFSEPDLKKMVTNWGLGTAEDVRKVSTKPKKIGYIELLWDGAKRRQT
jgi:hypothetical protein